MYLSNITTTTLLGVFLIFCRLSGAFMFLPLVSEIYVPIKIRLSLVIFISFIISPFITHTVIDNTFLSESSIMLLVICSELFVGITIGLATKILMLAMHTTGVIISTQIGLASASLFDVSQKSQGTDVSSLLSLLALATIISLDLHLIIIEALIHSYETIKPLHINHNIVSYIEFSELITNTITNAWSVGVRLASPLIVSGLLITISGALLSKLSPQLQVFFTLMPAQILTGIFILILAINGILNSFVDYYTNSLASIFF